MSQPNPTDPELPNEEGEDATTAPNNLDALRDEMIISVNLYLEALARLDSDNEEVPRLIPVDWAVIMTGFPDTGDAEQFFYRMDASGPPHTQVGIARILQLTLES